MPSQPTSDSQRAGRLLRRLVGVAAAVATVIVIASDPIGARAQSSHASQPSLTPDDLWPTDRVLDIQITLPQEDWNRLRHEDRDLMAWFHESRKEQPPKSPFNYVLADMTIDGVEFPRVGLRKKGFVGSLSTTRPSLKVRLDYSEKGKNYGGLSKLTLNNSNQDHSKVSQFMGYAFFNAAGSPASRCTFAEVTVNGQSLGVYAHVESVGRVFCRRAFGSDKGVLYEGSNTDFFEGWAGGFEHKFGNDEVGRAKIQQLIDLLQPGERLVTHTEIGEVIDLDAFYTFWATEGLLSFWDGYSANRNNFFIYLNPETDRFHFVPWGADILFNTKEKHRSPGAPLSVWLKGLLCYHLYQLPEGRKRLEEELRRLLADCWDEEVLVRELDRVQTMLAPHVLPEQFAIPNRVKTTRRFMETRRRIVMRELERGLPDWIGPPTRPAVIPGEQSNPSEYPAIWQAAGSGDYAALRQLLRLEPGEFSDDEISELASIITKIGSVMEPRRSRRGSTRLYLVAGLAVGCLALAAFLLWVLVIRKKA